MVRSLDGQEGDRHLQRWAPERGVDLFADEVCQQVVAEACGEIRPRLTILKGHGGQYTPMHEHAWVCDSCGKDVHTPRSRAGPPAGWRIVVVYGPEDDGPPPDQHYCSHRCEAAGPLPSDEIQEAQRRARQAQRREGQD